MGRNLIMLGMAIVVMSLVTLTIVGFFSGLTNPLAWFSLTLLIIVILVHNKLVSRRYLAWDERYSVGIKSIDDDHKKLIHLINNLQTAIDYKTDSKFEKQTLDEVIDYTQYHFTREEGLMEDNGYPGFEPHKATHGKMIDKVNELTMAYETGEEAAIEELLKYLKSWLIKHINGTDQEYSEYLISKGVK